MQPLMSKQTIKEVKQLLIDKFTYVKMSKGNFMVAKSYFYRGNQTAESFANDVQNFLNANGYIVNVVGKGDVWKAFRGGDTVWQGSRFWVTLNVNNK